MSHFRDHPPLKQSALRDLIEGGSAPFKQSARSWIMWCPEPTCQRQKLYVEKTTGACKCFRCGAKGWANWVLSKVYRRSPEELDELLYGIVSVGTVIDESAFKITDFWGEEEAEGALLPSEPKYPPAMARDPMWLDIWDPAASAGAAYLEGRGIPLSVAREYGIGFSAAEQRVLFPVVVEGILRGWQGRYIHPTQLVTAVGRIVNIPKVMTVGKLGKECLMFQDRLVGSEHAILAEGPLDVLKCCLVGGAVASMGKDVSLKQLDIILRSGVKKLYVGLDRDAAKEVGHIVKTLSGTLDLYRLLPPAHRDDLGDCTMEEVQAQFLVAEPMGPAHEHQVWIPMPKLWT